MKEIPFSLNSCYVTKILQLYTSCKYLTGRIWIILYHRCESHVIPCHQYPAAGKLLSNPDLIFWSKGTLHHSKTLKWQVHKFNILRLSFLLLSPVSSCLGARLSLHLISSSLQWLLLREQGFAVLSERFPSSFKSSGQTQLTRGLCRVAQKTTN